MTSPPILIELFGGLRALPQDRPAIVFTPQHTGALLAYLALHRKRSHAREELLEWLWPETEPEEARHNLRQCLYSLRRQLETPPFDKNSVLVTTRATVQLNPDIVVTDVALFEEAMQNAQACGLRERIAHMRRAVDLYQGELLPGFYQDGFVAERNRLSHAFQNTLLALAAAQEQTGDHTSAMECARRAVMLDPLMEEGYRVLMRLYAALGQPAGMQRQYHELERVLLQELGTTPSEETKRLLASLRQNGATVQSDPPATDGTASAAPCPPLPSSPPATLPVEETLLPAAGEERIPQTHVSRRLHRFGPVAALGVVVLSVLLVRMVFGPRSGAEFIGLWRGKQTWANGSYTDFFEFRIGAGAHNGTITVLHTSHIHNDPPGDSSSVQSWSYLRKGYAQWRDEKVYADVHVRGDTMTGVWRYRDENGDCVGGPPIGVHFYVTRVGR